MRIIAGRFRGRVLEAPPDVRPSSDRLREALFSLLQHALDGVFVDAFAGSGAVGLEALSRGAATVFVEREPRSLETLRDNLASLGLAGAPEALVVEADAQRWFKRPGDLPGNARSASVVFADPPYDYGPREKLLRVIAASPIVSADTLVVFEHRRGGLPGRRAPGLVHERTAVYGESAISLYRPASVEEGAGDATEAPSAEPSETS